MGTDRIDRKHGFTIIEGGKPQEDDNFGGPEFGDGIKAEEAKDTPKPLTAEEVDDMHEAPVTEK